MTYKTKYHGATDYKGARISVTDWNGKRTYHSFRYDLNSEERHKCAADERAKIDKIEYPCAVFVQIPCDGGYVWSTRNEATE